MNKRLLMLLVIVLFTLTTKAQQQAQIKQIAQLMAKATIAGDFATLAKYTHPKVVSMMGGPDKMIAAVKNGFAQMKTNGVTFKEAVVGQPGKIINTGANLYSVVPQRVTLLVNGMAMSSNSSLVAYSPNKGKNWYFTDVGRMNAAQLKSVFPDAYDKLIIPKATQNMVPKM